MAQRRNIAANYVPFVQHLELLLLDLVVALEGEVSQEVVCLFQEVSLGVGIGELDQSGITIYYIN